MTASSETEFWKQFGVKPSTVWLPVNSPSGKEVKARAKIAKFDHLLDLIYSGELEASEVLDILSRRNAPKVSELALHKRKVYLREVGKEKGRADLMKKVDTVHSDLLEAVLLVNTTPKGPLKSLASAGVYAVRGKLDATVELWEALSGWTEREDK